MAEYNSLYIEVVNLRMYALNSFKNVLGKVESDKMSCRAKEVNLIMPIPTGNRP